MISNDSCWNIATVLGEREGFAAMKTPPPLRFLSRRKMLKFWGTISWSLMDGLSQLSVTRTISKSLDIINSSKSESLLTILLVLSNPTFIDVKYEFWGLSRGRSGCWEGPGLRDTSIDIVMSSGGSDPGMNRQVAPCLDHFVIGTLDRRWEFNGRLRFCLGFNALCKWRHGTCYIMHVVS